MTTTNMNYQMMEESIIPLPSASSSTWSSDQHNGNNVDYDNDDDELSRPRKVSVDTTTGTGTTTTHQNNNRSTQRQRNDVSNTNTTNNNDYVYHDDDVTDDEEVKRNCITGVSTIKDFDFFSTDDDLAGDDDDDDDDSDIDSDDDDHNPVVQEPQRQEHQLEEIEEEQEDQEQEQKHLVHFVGWEELQKCHAPSDVLYRPIPQIPKPPEPSHHLLSNPPVEFSDDAVRDLKKDQDDQSNGSNDDDDGGEDDDELYPDDLDCGVGTGSDGDDEMEDPDEEDGDDGDGDGDNEDNDDDDDEQQDQASIALEMDNSDEGDDDSDESERDTSLSQLYPMVVGASGASVEDRWEASKQKRVLSCNTLAALNEEAGRNADQPKRYRSSDLETTSSSSTSDSNALTIPLALPVPPQLSPRDVMISQQHPPQGDSKSLTITSITKIEPLPRWYDMRGYSPESSSDEDSCDKMLSDELKSIPKNHPARSPSTMPVPLLTPPQSPRAGNNDFHDKNDVDNNRETVEGNVSVSTKCQIEWPSNLVVDSAMMNIRQSLLRPLSGASLRDLEEQYNRNDDDDHLPEDDEYHHDDDEDDDLIQLLQQDDQESLEIMPMFRTITVDAGGTV